MEVTDFCKLFFVWKLLLVLWLDWEGVAEAVRRGDNGLGIEFVIPVGDRTIVVFATNEVLK